MRKRLEKYSPVIMIKSFFLHYIKEYMVFISRSTSIMLRMELLQISLLRRYIGGYMTSVTII